MTYRVKMKNCGYSLVSLEIEDYSAAQATSSVSDICPFASAS